MTTISGRRIFGLALICSLLLSVGCWLGFRWWAALVEQTIAPSEPTSVLTVEAGQSLGSILQALAVDGSIRYPKLVGWWAKWADLDRGIQVGEYPIEPSTTVKQLLQMFNDGRVIRYKVTLPEGITLAQALDILHGTPQLERIIEDSKDPVVAAIVAPNESPEGWFLPETYHFVKGNTDADILRRAHELMDNALDRTWQQRASDLPLVNSYEALILASIVERETSVPAERPLIAGVFIRRLQKGMRLQTDPSVIYGLGVDFDGNLRHRHLRDKANRWNTYQISGLPPTPIALPGIQAIKAVVNPQQGDALYFVGKGDGYHSFAPTLEAHQSNVRRYQLQRRSDYRSTPAT